MATQEKIEELAQWAREFAAQSPGARLPSERELAERFGVSRPKVRTVLQELQGEGLVETRLGSGTYGIDLAAQPLRKVVILVDAHIKLGNDPFFTLVFERLQAAAQKAGIRATIERIHAESRPVFAEEAAITLGWAGERLVSQGRLGNARAVALLAGIDLKPTPRCSTFRLDDRAAGQAAYKRLQGRGCGEILFVGRDDVGASRERYLGAKSAEAAECPVRLVECSLNYPAGLKLAQTNALSQNSRAGIIATNDWLAAGIRAGLGAPGRSSNIPIVSFDGLPLTSDPAMGIESFAVPIEQIVEDAILELQRLHKSQAAGGRSVLYSLTEPA